MINIEQLRFPSGIAGRPLREQQWTRGARPAPRAVGRAGIRCRERLGGLLRYYYQAA